MLHPTSSGISSSLAGSGWWQDVPRQRSSWPLSAWAAFTAAIAKRCAGWLTIGQVKPFPYAQPRQRHVPDLRRRKRRAGKPTRCPRHRLRRKTRQSSCLRRRNCIRSIIFEAPAEELREELPYTGEIAGRHLSSSIVLGSDLCMVSHRVELGARRDKQKSRPADEARGLTPLLQLAYTR